MGEKKKKYRVLKVTLLVIALHIVGFLALYHFIQTPAFLAFAIRQLNNNIAGEMSYDELNLDLQNRHLRIRGLVYKNTAGAAILSVKSLDMNFAFISALKGNLAVSQMRAEGIVIDQRNSEKNKAPSSWRTALRVILKRISVRDTSIADTHIYLRNGDEFHFTGTQVTVTPQQLEKQEVTVEVNETTLKPADAEIHSGPLYFHGKVTIPYVKDFSFLVSEAEGNLKLQDVQVGALPASSFESEFKIGGNTLYLINGKLVHPDGVISTDVDYIPDTSTYKIDLKTTHPFPMSAIPHVSQQLVQTFKTFELSLRAELTGFALDKMTGKVELEAKVLGDIPNPKIPEIDLDLKGKMKQGTLDLDQFKIKSVKTDITATGKVDFAKQKFDVGVKTTGFDLVSLIQALSDLDISGYANAEGTIKGDFKNPEMIFNAKATESGYSFLHFGEIQGLFKIQNNILTFEGGATPGKGVVESVTVKTENIFKKEKHTSLKTSFNNLDVGPLTDNSDLKGHVSGTFDLDAVTNVSPTGVMKATIDDFWLNQFHIGKIEAQGKLGNRKFIIDPLTFEMPNYPKLAIPAPAVFAFDDKGVQLTGEILPGAQIKGSYLYNGPKVFNLEGTVKNMDLRPLMASLSVTPYESYADGKVKMAIRLGGATDLIDVHIDRLLIPLEEGQIREAEPIDISIEAPKITFKRAKIRSGSGVLDITGTYMMEGNSNLGIKGRLDLAMANMFPSLFREGSGFANVDLKVGGNLDKPQVTGSIDFNDASLTLRLLRGNIENLKGKLIFKPNAVEFNNLSGSIAEGDLIVNGQIGLKDFKPSFYDLKAEAREATFSQAGVYKITFNGNFSLKGPAEGPLLAGDMFISEGRYSRNFGITEFILKPEANAFPEPPNPFLQNLMLNLTIKSPGELAIKNNVAKMYLQSDIHLRGHATKPEVSGAMEVLDGTFNYFKISFQDARGYIDFRDPKHGPYVDVTARKEFVRRNGSINVLVQIQGFTDNLKINFTSDVGLEKRDILALIFTGALPGEASGFTTTQLAGSVLISQLNSLLENTVANKGSVDIVRLESPDTTRNNLRNNFSTLVIGKQVTPRLSLEFKTDLGADNPTQGIQMEYLIFDNVLLEGSQLTDGSFNFNFTLRWKHY